MFLIPWGSDAILYHLPIVTVGMILLNIVIFLGTNSAQNAMEPDEFITFIQPWILEYGKGLRPWQWVTTNFLHGGWMHLIGNMCAMWGFGFVVEGKIGWWRYLLVFLGIGVLQSASQQVVMLWADGGGALGASSIVFGLLAICMVWAPANQTQCLLFLFFRVFFFEMTFYMLAILLVAMQILGVIMSGMQWGSEVLHLFGAVTGFAIGVVMLKKGWVDCEGWDLFNVWAGESPMTSQQESLNSEADALLAQATATHLSKLKEERSQSLPELDEDGFGEVDLFGSATETTLEKYQAQIHEDLTSGDAASAFQHLGEAAELYGVKAFERDLEQVVSALNRAKLWQHAVPAMVLYLKHFTRHQIPVRLQLARVLLDIKHRPDQALAVLAKIPATEMNEKQRTQFSALQQKARSAG